MTEISKTGPQIRDRGWTPLMLVVAAATVFVYLFGLTIPLVGPDEPRYAQVAREMYQRSDWVTPTLGGFNWFEKPALLYWLEIAAYNVFGVSEFSARVGPALFGLGTILAIWIFARVAESGTQRESRFGFAEWAAVVAASTIGLIVFSRGASFDIVLTFPITASLTGFFIFDRGGRGRFWGLAAFYFFIGVSLLAKGLVGIVIPFAVVGLYYVLSLRLPDRTFIISLFWGTLLSVAVSALWYVPMYRTHGYRFIDEFFVQHHFQRFTSNKYLHPQPFLFFFWVLPLMTIPWLPLFLPALWQSIRDVIRDLRSAASGRRRHPERAFAALAVAWIAVPVVFFSFSGSKLPGYVLPAVPGTILLTADFVMRWVDGRPRRALLLKWLAAATLMFAFAALVLVVPQVADANSVKSLFAAADREGYGEAKVVAMHTVSYNSEFYAAGRLLRTPDGKLKKLLGPAEVRDEIRALGGAPVLVLIPIEYLFQLKNADYLNSVILKDNGELALVAVSESGP